MKTLSGMFAMALIIIAVMSCNNRKPSEFDSLSAIEGTWFMDVDGNGGGILERWERVNDTLFTGMSAEINGADTILSENIQLVSGSSGIYYIPTVLAQNDAQPVRFKLTGSDGQRFVFENTGHDFPTAIIYNFVGTDSLVATVSGVVKGENRMLEFRYSKE